MKKPPLILLAALALAQCKPSEQGYTYETATLSRGDMRAYVTATGTLSALVSVDVGSQVSGRIVTLSVDYNSPVKKGDLVAEIDPAIYRAAVKQAEGDLASARATVTLRQQALKRKQALVPMRAATELDLEQAVAELAQAEASVTIKEAALDQANANMSYCRIIAPVDGIVISRKVDLGQTVAAAMTTPVLYTIAQDIRKMQIVASVSEADVGQVKVGQKVEFTVEAFPDEVFEGLVTQVRMAPVTKENVVTYETIIGVDNKEQKLFPGMTADASILVAERRDTLRVPNTALRFTPPENAAVTGRSDEKLQRRQDLVYVLEADNKTLRAAVMTHGITDNTDTEVLGGLEPGARVVTASRTGVKPGGSGPGHGPPPQT